MWIGKQNNEILRNDDILSKFHLLRYSSIAQNHPLIYSGFFSYFVSVKETSIALFKRSNATPFKVNPAIGNNIRAINWSKVNKVCNTSGQTTRCVRNWRDHTITFKLFTQNTVHLSLCAECLKSNEMVSARCYLNQTETDHWCDRFIL